MINLSFNGISNNTIGVLVKSSTHLNRQGKKIELIDIPGRSDALVIDDGVKPNKEITVVFIADARATKNLKAKLDTIENWLINTTGYKILSYDDGYSFNAVVTSGLEVNKIHDYVAECTIKFSCKAI